MNCQKVCKFCTISKLSLGYHCASTQHLGCLSVYYICLHVILGEMNYAYEPEIKGGVKCATSIKLIIN